MKLSRMDLEKIMTHLLTQKRKSLQQSQTIKNALHLTQKTRQKLINKNIKEAIKEEIWIEGEKKVIKEGSDINN